MSLSHGSVARRFIQTVPAKFEFLLDMGYQGPEIVSPEDFNRRGSCYATYFAKDMVLEISLNLDRASIDLSTWIIPKPGELRIELSDVLTQLRGVAPDLVYDSRANTCFLLDRSLSTQADLVRAILKRRQPIDFGEVIEQHLAQ